MKKTRKLKQLEIVHAFYKMYKKNCIPVMYSTAQDAPTETTFADLLENMQSEGRRAPALTASDTQLIRALTDDEKLHAVPDKILFYGDLEVTDDFELDELPDNLYVLGHFVLHANTLSKLPKKMVVNLQTCIRSEEITCFPACFEARGGLDISGSAIRDLPKQLLRSRIVYGDLLLANSLISSLPAGLIVYGDLNLSGSRVLHLPERSHILGELVITEEFSYSIPKSLYCKGLVLLSLENMSLRRESLHAETKIFVHLSWLKDMRRYNPETFIASDDISFLTTVSAKTLAEARAIYRSLEGEAAAAYLAISPFAKRI